MAGKHRKRMTWVAAIVAIIFAWGCWESYQLQKLVPPESANTLESFSQLMPPPNKLVIVEFQGQEKIIWLGEIPPFTLVSGPACYVFDERGGLVDWSVDSGEGGTTEGLAEAASRGTAISIHEAIERIAVARQ